MVVTPVKGPFKKSRECGSGRNVKFFRSISYPIPMEIKVPACHVNERRLQLRDLSPTFWTKPGIPLLPAVGCCGCVAAFPALPFAPFQVLVISVDPSVDWIRFAGGSAFQGGRFAFHDARVGRLTHEFRRNEDFDADAPVLQLAGRLDARAAREESVVLGAHLSDQHAVVLDDVIVI